MVLVVNPYDKNLGPAIHASEFIDYLRKNKKMRVYQLAFFEKKKDSLKINGKLKTLFISLFFILPTQSARYFSLSNINIIRKKIDEIKPSTVYFFGFSYLAFYVKFIKHQNVVITMPDAQSKRYYQALKKKSRNIKTYLQFVFYRILEIRTLKYFKTVHLVSKDDMNYLKLENTKYIPFQISKNSLCSLNIKKNTLIILGPTFGSVQLDLALKLSRLSFLDKVVLHDPNKSYNKPDIISKINENKIQIINWIDNYQQFVTEFHYIILSDPDTSTGMSTRTTQMIYSGNIVFGNKIAYRNINKDGIFDEYIFEDHADIILKLKNINLEGDMHPSKCKILFLHEMMNYKKVMREQIKLLV